jgi:DNA-binding GntR family transcriptional regulator
MLYAQGMMAGGEQCISSYVLKTIRDGILSGRYPLGSRLDQQALAEELGVSVIPVREGLRQLEAEGLVQIYPRRGVYVAEPSVDLRFPTSIPKHLNN